MQPPQHTPPTASDIDRRALATLVQRFKWHQSLRIRRTGLRLGGRQRRVLDALAALYHANHPALPGYVGPDVPSGIAGYRPDAAALAAVQRVARSYRDPAPTAGAATCRPCSSWAAAAASVSPAAATWICGSAATV